MYQKTVNTFNCSNRVKHYAMREDKVAPTHSTPKLIMRHASSCVTARWGRVYVVCSLDLWWGQLLHATIQYNFFYRGQELNFCITQLLVPWNIFRSIFVFFELHIEYCCSQAVQTHYTTPKIFCLNAFVSIFKTHEY